MNVLAVTETWQRNSHLFYDHQIKMEEGVKEHFLSFKEIFMGQSLESFHTSAISLQEDTFSFKWRGKITSPFRSLRSSEFFPELRDLPTHPFKLPLLGNFLPQFHTEGGDDDLPGVPGDRHPKKDEDGE